MRTLLNLVLLGLVLFFCAGTPGAAACEVPEGISCPQAKLKNMETSLRDKAKDFGTVHRSYESIFKHNQVRRPSWQGGNGLDADTHLNTCAHTLGRNAAGSGVERCEESDAGAGGRKDWGLARGNGDADFERVPVGTQ